MINVENYIPMVHKLASKQYAKFKSRYSYDDMFQTGCVGLMLAAEKFDASKGAKFFTYAYRCVEWHIINSVRNDRWYIAKNAQERTRKSYAPDSLDKSVGDTSMVDLMMGDISEYSDFDLEIAVDKLPENFRKIIKAKYFEDYTWDKVSKVTNIPKSTLYKYKNEALNLLRKELAM